MSEIITYTYTNPNNYTFDTNLIEVTGGFAKLKDQTPTDSISGATYTTDEDLSFGGGTLTGTLNGGAVVTGGQLDCTAGTTAGVSYSASGNFDFGQTGCVRISYVPNYNGAPGANRVLWSCDSPGEIFVQHRSTGTMRVSMKDSSDVLIFDVNLGNYTAVSGVATEIELNWDLNAGATRLFVNGIQSNGDITQTGTRGTSTTFYLGAFVLFQNGADAKYNDIIVYDTVQHTSNYTPNTVTVPETRYDLTNPDILTNAGITTSALLSFSETSIKVGSDEIKYTLVVDGVDKWWNGGAVVTSNGTYAEANTATEIDTNIADFVTASRTLVKTRAFLHSDDGSTTPELDSITIQYDSDLPDPELPTLTMLEGFIYDKNTAVANELLEVRPFESGWINGGVFQKYEWQTLGITDSDGWFESDILVQPTGRFYEIRVVNQRYKIELADQGVNNLKDAFVEVVTEDE